MSLNRSAPSKGCRLTNDHQTPKRHLVSHQFRRQPKGLLLRCSRPLCSSQNTGGTPTRTRHPPETGGLWSETGQGSRGAVQAKHPKTPAGPVPQDPTACKDQARRQSPVPAPQVRRTERTTFGPGHNVNVPPMSATGEHVSPKWLGKLVALYTEALARAP